MAAEERKFVGTGADGERIFASVSSIGGQEYLEVQYEDEEGNLTGVEERQPVEAVLWFHRVLEAWYSGMKIVDGE